MFILAHYCNQNCNFIPSLFTLFSYKEIVVLIHLLGRYRIQQISVAGFSNFTYLITI